MERLSERATSVWRLCHIYLDVHIQRSPRNSGMISHQGLLSVLVNINLQAHYIQEVENWTEYSIRIKATDA